MKNHKAIFIFWISAIIVMGQWEAVHGQDAHWTLSRCVAYAKEHNLSVNKTAFNERTAEMTLELSKMALLPGISLGSSYGRNYGRSINPTTNQFENRSYGFTGLNASGNVLLFGWFQKRETIKKNKLSYQAALADQNQLEDDIFLNIATGYLRILLAKEQIQISEAKMRLSEKQVQQTTLMLDAGKSNGQDLAQIRTQLSQDSAIHFKNLLSYQLAVIDMKVLLNLDFEADFAPVSIGAEALTLNELAIKPNDIYQAAEAHFGKIKSNDLKVKIASKNIKIVKANLYPQISLSGSSGTNYSSSYNEYLPTGDSRPMPWGRQLRNNLSQSFSLGISFPLFNGLSNRYAVRQAGIDLRVTQFENQEARLQLKQEVYKAYSDAQTSLQTYYAAISTQGSADLAFDFATKRYDKGLISAMDLLIAQNQANEAKINLSATKYDLTFKLMVLRYYLGTGF